MKHIQKEITDSLIHAAAGYGRAGLDIVLRKSGSSTSNPQVAIGNLSIATELLFKALIAKCSLLLLFKDLPLELRCALAASDAMPKSFCPMPHEIELRASGFKSIELDEAIAAFCIFYPDFKKRFGSHLRFLSKCRNICVHAVHPGYRVYEVERTAFLFLSLVDYLRKEEPTVGVFLRDDDESKEFVARFNEERIARVHKKTEDAKEKAKMIKDSVSFGPEEWEWYPIKCPVCALDGILSGETTAEPCSDRDGVVWDTSLSFTGETFECEHCGLILDDYEEMLIAGIDPEIDRADELDKWQEEHSIDEHHEYWR